jgi:MATE family multidrug resistance protein
MLANVTTPLLGVVSTAAIGRLGDAALLGGVAMAAVIFDCLFWLFSFLRMGTIALTAQAMGARRPEEHPLILLRGFMIAGFVGLLLIVLQYPLGTALFGLIGGSEGVTSAAKSYFAIRIFAAPVTLANYVVLGWLVGQARARLALGVQIAINVGVGFSSAPLLGVFSFAYDGVFIGATWARDMRNLMILSLIIYFAAWALLRPFGNAGLWVALLVHYAARGGLQALRYPALLRKSFGD